MKYKLLKDGEGAKAGMIFEWNKLENAYTTKEMSWITTPMIDRYDMQRYLKIKLFKKLGKKIKNNK